MPPKPKNTAKGSTKKPSPSAKEVDRKSEGLQRQLDLCRQELALLRANFNPTKIRAELAKVEIVEQDKEILYQENIRHIYEEFKQAQAVPNGSIETKENETLRKELEETKSKFESQQKQMKKLEEEYNQLNAEHKVLCDERDQLKRKNDEATSARPVQEMNTTLQSLEQENKRLTTEKQDIESTSNRQKGEIVSLKEKLKKSEEELSQIQANGASEKSILEEKMKDLEKKLRNSEPVQEMNTTLQSLEQEKKRLTTEKQDIESISNSQKEEIASLKQKLGKSEEELRQIKADSAFEKNILEEKMKDLENKLRNSETERNEARTATKSDNSQDDKVQRLNDKIRSLENDLKLAKTSSEEQKKEIKATKDTNHQLSTSQAQHEASMNDVQAENDDLKKTIKQNKEEVQTLREIQAQHEASMNDVQAENKDLKKTIKQNKEEVQKLRDQLQTQQKKSSSAKEDTDTSESVKKENGQLKAKLGEIEEENKKLKTDVSAGKIKVADLEKKCHAAFEQEEKKDEELKRQKAEHDKLIERKDSTIADLRRKQHMVDPTAGSSTNSKRLQELEAENDHLKSRLSEIVGAKLTSNNPEIADLSDEYRPQKLGEMYSELYDNEWTDAFEEIEPGKGSEQAAIQYLRQILEDSYLFSMKEAADYCSQVTDGLLKFKDKSQIMKEDKLPLTLKRLLVDLRKKTSPYLKNQVSKKFVEKNTKMGDNEKTFRGKCAELCWLMAMQDPPVVLNTSGGSGDFDTDRYRVYTKRGKSVDYIVWPPLQLHKEGALLSKGVAQGK